MFFGSGFHSWICIPEDASNRKPEGECSQRYWLRRLEVASDPAVHSEGLGTMHMNAFFRVMDKMHLQNREEP